MEFYSVVEIIKTYEFTNKNEERAFKQKGNDNIVIVIQVSSKLL